MYTSQNAGAFPECENEVPRMKNAPEILRGITYPVNLL